MSTVNHIMACNGGSNSETVATGVVGASIGAIASWIVTRIFTNLTGTAGLVFGAAFSIGGMAAYTTFVNYDHFFGNSLIEAIAKCIIIFLASVTSGYLGVLWTGTQITFAGSLALGILMSLTTVITVIGALYILSRISKSE